jgi:predicted dinucleotide-binding enzyme
VLVAVAWEGLRDMLAEAEAPNGSMAGKPVIDCTNAVDYTTGLLQPREGAAAQLVAELAVGAHPVKALQLFAGQSWLESDQRTCRSGAQSRVTCSAPPGMFDGPGLYVVDWRQRLK